MRTAVRLVACAIAALVAGCSAVELGYYREGIGSELYRSDLPEVTRLQDDYIDYICRQSNLAPPGLSPQERCVLPLASRDWSLFVQAGMNDIDRRCDHFLNWVDYHRRNDKHITKQVADTIFAVTTIARVTGSPARSMDVLAAALGLASATFENTTARLLTLANQSTIQSVVIVNQNKYRQSILNEVIDNRPAAIHVLRSYLRICMPATIETEINVTTTIAQRGGAGGIAAIQQRPMSTVTTVPRRAVITDVSVPLRRPLQLPTGAEDDIRVGDAEKRLTVANIKSYQKLVCVEETGKLGPRGSDTRLRMLDHVVRADSQKKRKDRDAEGNILDVFSERDRGILNRSVRATKGSAGAC